MSLPKSPEELIRELKEQNADLANTAQYWKLQFKKCDDERANLQKLCHELILRKRQYSHKMKACCNLLQEYACRSIGDILQFSKQAEAVGDIIEDYDENYETTGRETASGNFSQSNSPLSNIHHVRPMIGGVTLKTPILRVSRADLGVLNRPGVMMNNDAMQCNSTPPMNLSSQATAPNEVQNVSVCLERIDTGNSYAETSDRNVARDLTVSGSRSDSDPIGQQGAADTPQETNTIEETNESLNLVSNEVVDNASQEEESNDNCYINHDELFPSDFTTNENVRSGERLTCIMEESTVENTRATVSGEAATNSDHTVDSNLESTTANEAYESPKQGEVVDDGVRKEDPLEGPSWLFNSDKNNSMPRENRRSRFNFVTERKKRGKPKDESLFDDSNNSKDVDQVPDSTTDVKDGHSLDIAIDNLTSPQCQSTPNPLIKPNEIENPQTISEEDTQETVYNHNLNVKVILSRMRGKSPQKLRKSVEKKGKKRARKCVNNLFPSKSPKASVTPKRISHPSTSSIDENSNASGGDSSAFENSSRPKRTAKKNYKEPSCIKKLRRV